MSGFFYWIPGRTSISVAELVEMGLGYAIEDTRTPRGCDKGPDGHRGVCVCHGANADGRLGYWPEKQTWRQVPSSDLWVGMYTDDPPGPDSLARKDQIDGEWLKLDDGRQWLAPTARKRFEADGELFWSYNVPRRLTLDESGAWVPGDVKPRYQRLWQDALRCEASVIDGSDVVDLDELAIRALQINYRISAVELDLLGIYDENARTAIVSALIDLKTWTEWLKKTALRADVGEDSSPGLTDTPPIIIPPLQTSER